MKKVRIGTKQKLINYVRANDCCRISTNLFHELFPEEFRAAKKHAQGFKPKLNLIDKMRRKISKQEAFMFAFNKGLITYDIGIEPGGENEYIVSDWS